MLAAVVGRQFTGRGPPIWGLFVVGALLTVGSGVLPVRGAETALVTAGPVLIFLFALFLFASALEQGGVLDHLARWLIGRARSPEDLPVVLFVGFGLGSAFLVNDALVVIGVPLLVAVARRLAMPARPLLLTLAISVSVGSVFTPFGNPQNLLVSLDSGVGTPFVVFLRYLFLPTVVSVGLGAWLLGRLFASQAPNDLERFAAVRSEAPPLLPSGGWGERLARRPVLWVFPATMITLLTFDFTAALTHGPTIPSWETAAFGAVLLVAVTPGRPKIVRKVNWEVLLLFAGLFVVVAGALEGGVVAALQHYLPIPGPGPGPGPLLAIAGTTVAGAQLVSNVPWVTIEIPILHAAGYSGATPVAWMALAGAATLSGNVTLLGAASNLIVVELAEKDGVPIRLTTFVRYALPVAGLSLGVLLAFLYAGL